MQVNCKEIMVSRAQRVAGRLEERPTECVVAERAPIADLDGLHTHSINNLRITAEVERVGGNGHFTQLKCRLSVPALNKEKTVSFGVNLLNGKTVGREDIWLGLDLGKLDQQAKTNDDLQLVVEVLDEQEVQLSRTLPIVLQNN